MSCYLRFLLSISVIISFFVTLRFLNEQQRITLYKEGRLTNLKKRDVWFCSDNSTKIEDCLNIETRTSKQCFGDGLLLLPQQKLALCLLTKIATTTWKFVAMRLLGVDPQQICSCTDLEWGCLRGDINNHAHSLWQGAVWARDVDVRDLHDIMHNPESNWTSIAMIRKPWHRAISAFWEDNKSRLAPQTFLHPSPFHKKKLQLEFLAYLQGKNTCHSHPMTDYCGLSHFDFDYVPDLENGFYQLAEIFSKKQNILMTTGWDACMKDSNPSFFGDSIDSPHHGIANSTFWSSMICTNRTLSLVYLKYANEFALYEKHFPGKRIGCIAE